MALSAYKFFKYPYAENKDSKHIHTHTHTHTSQGKGTEERGLEKRKVFKVFRGRMTRQKQGVGSRQLEPDKRKSADHRTLDQKLSCSLVSAC